MMIADILGDMRSVTLDWFGGGWDSGCWFAAIRK